MIKSKGIRIVCYVCMGLSCFLAVVMFFCGCSALVDEKVDLGIGLIVLAIVIPFSVTLSLYPIFALSLIESHVSQINDNIEQLSSKLDTLLTPPSPTMPQNPPASEPTPTPTPTPSPQSTMTPTTPITDAIDFINRKYNAGIEDSDDLITIQEKILKIEALDTLTQIFKTRVANASNFDEVCSVIKMHHAVTKNTLTPQ